MRCTTDFDITYVFLIVLVLNRNGIERLQLGILMRRVGWRGWDEGSKNKRDRE